MTYEGALKYLSELGEARIQPGLTRIIRALASLQNPQLDYATVLVGGTNGKGSTVSFLSSILSAAGHRVGMFTSPHLLRFEERIRVGGERLPSEELAGLLQQVRDCGVDLSYFEMSAAMAMAWFRSQAVDIAVLEVGLGGRWDATNAADPLVSVITTIDLDHREWLGTSLPEVAGEKAQIMRSARPVVVGPVRGEALAVLASEAAAKGALILRFGEDFFLEPEGKESFVYRDGGGTLDGIKLGIPGLFQAPNAACAVAAAGEVARHQFPVPRRAVLEGLASARWPGRFQTIPGNPPVVLDCAHNPAALEALASELRRGPGTQAWVFSALEGKDVEGMARIVAVAGGPVYLVELEMPRALDAGRLARSFEGLGIPVRVASGAREAIDLARLAAGPKGRVVVTGSCYLVGRAMQLLQGSREGDLDGV